MNRATTPMVRQRKHDHDKKQNTERRERESPEQQDRRASSPEESPKPAAAAANMQYVSNSRSKARLSQLHGPSPSICRWLIRLRLTRFILLLAVIGFSGFMVGRAFHRGILAGPDQKSAKDTDAAAQHPPGPHQSHASNLKNGQQISDRQQNIPQQQPGAPLHVQQPALHDEQQAAQHKALPPLMSEEERRAQELYDMHRRARAARQQGAYKGAQQPLVMPDKDRVAQEVYDQHQAQKNAAHQHAAQEPPVQPPLVRQPGDPNQSANQPAGQPPAVQLPAGQPPAAQLPAGQQSANQIQIPKKLQIQDAPSDTETYPYHVIQTLTNTHKMPHLKTRFVECTKSILDKASINLHFFFVVDEPSRKFVLESLQDITNQHIAKSKFQFHFIEVDELAKQLAPLVSMLQERVSGGHPYYQDAIFFLSVAIHRGVLPSYVRRVVMLDTDLKFMTDIKELFDHFDRFTPSNIMAFAREMQPVYCHLFSLYRSQNKGTKVGDPPPDGLTGFNSGVVLLDLERMRSSAAYRGFVNEARIQELTSKYSFKGHLGDQDFFTLISLERPDLFYILPCSWNRQLCVWWRDKGYMEVFDQYFTCNEKIHIYHGNCNTPIPY